MKKYTIINLILLFFPAFIYAQTQGINEDPLPGTAGQIPYEMKDRKEDRTSTFDFTDCSKWIVKPNQCEAKLYRTKDQIVTTPYSGKVIYKTFQKAASFDVMLKEPLRFSNEWDCIDVWTWGAHWLWGEPSYLTAMQFYAIIRDANGKIQVENMVQGGYPQLVHKYWFMNHMKLQDMMKPGSAFLGFRFKGEDTDPGTEHTIYLSSGYIYKEELKPLTFRKFPDKLPFPTRKETILPLNKSNYKNQVSVKGDLCSLTYQGDDCEIAYEIPCKEVLGDVSILYNNQKKQVLRERSIILENDKEARLSISQSSLKNDTLYLKCKLDQDKWERTFSIWYTIRQKSLIMGIIENAEKGCVKEIRIGEIISDTGKKVVVPYLNFDYKLRPYILSDNSLFTFAIFDWYYTNASTYKEGDQQKNRFNLGKVGYIPKTNGERNPVREKLFINISPDVWEVFPTIDNPASPMRSFQADRLWDVDGDTDLDRLKKYATQLRDRGVEKVSIRYHEGFWREDGESFTFKTTPNPVLGVENIKKHIEFIKSKDWRVGLYTNYTDFSPVNSLFNPDWVKRGPNGQWDVSWSRCYTPKPQIAWEQEAIIAPQIHKIFDVNHMYCDVHTAVSPMSRIDYDYRVPAAAMIRGVIERYGMLLLNERKNYQGPVFSEGGNHWWYAGLIDGNYANDDLGNLPVFPDFSLLKIHPLEIDAANFDTGRKYLAYALAYGNIGMLAGVSDETLRRYAFLQPIQEEYVMIPVNSIYYYDNGQRYTASEAIQRNIITTPQLHINYQSGLQVYVNFSEKNWSFPVNGKTISLPQYGFYVYHPDKKLKSSSVIDTGNPLDEVHSDNLFYVNAHGRSISNPLGGNGEYMIKKEKFSWEIIPVSKEGIIEFDLSLIGLNKYKVMIVPIDNEGKNLDDKSTFYQNRISVKHQSDILKYRIVPVESLIQ